MNNIIFIWLALGLFFLILEMGMPGLFFLLSFAIGSVIAGIASLWIDSFTNQAIIFLIGTAVSFIILRYWVAQQEEKTPSPALMKTNIDALRNKRGIILKAVSQKHAGVVKIGGEVWTARTHFQGTLAVGTEVEVIDVIGAHVIVALPHDD